MQAETTFDLRYNIAALCIAILSENARTPEQAFAVIEDVVITKAYSNEDTLDMIRLNKQGFTYKEIGDMYGVSKEAINGKIRKHRKKTSLDCHPKRSIN